MQELKCLLHLLVISLHEHDGKHDIGSLVGHARYNKHIARCQLLAFIQVYKYHALLPPSGVVNNHLVSDDDCPFVMEVVHFLVSQDLFSVKLLQQTLRPFAWIIFNLDIEPLA